MGSNSRDIEIIEYEENKINVPWGHLSVIWHGSKLNKPILAVHGWMDNACSFDTLIPLLPSNVSVLVIELPGHGFSSPIPAGMTYHPMHYLFSIKFVMDAYKWKTVALLGHSLGSQIVFHFAALFPEKVEFLIMLDSFFKRGIKPLPLDEMRLQTEKCWELYIKNQSFKEPPSYTYEECIDKLHEGSGESVSKESAKYLLKRNLRKSELFPNKYYFSRDGRLRYSSMFHYENNLVKEMARRITFPFLLIKCDFENFSINDDFRKIYDYIELMQQDNPNFSSYLVSGTHHVHLCEPEKVAKFVKPFLEKFYTGYGEAVKNKL